MQRVLKTIAEPIFDEEKAKKSSDQASQRIEELRAEIDRNRHLAKKNAFAKGTVGPAYYRIVMDRRNGLASEQGSSQQKKA